MERGLTPSLKEKIDKFDKNHPYVWRLRLSKTDFEELESYVNSIVSNEGVTALTTPGYALITIIYLAEWYKRCYEEGNTSNPIEGLDPKTLWEHSGINQRVFLYKSEESGRQLYLYSIYVLGGLAVRFEAHRNNDKFLQGLCRIYHEENYSLDRLDDASRAIAFRESINQQHSLYEYFKQILNGDFPYNEEELNDDTSDVNRLVHRIKTANDEILKEKFRLEWVVNFSPNRPYMYRRLNIWLKPEKVRGGLHQYLLYDRVHLWGVPNPEQQHSLYVFVRFKYGGQVIEPSLERPIITFINHQLNDFVAFGVERKVQVKHIPTKRFDTIEIIIKDDNDNEYVAMTTPAKEYLQLWRENEWDNNWTSTPNAQKQTALIFSSRCHLTQSPVMHEILSKKFHSQLSGDSEIWNWVHIHESVTMMDSKYREITFYNRTGYDQITTRLYTDCIRYHEGEVMHYSIDDIDDEESTEYLPLIFSKEDLIVRHFKTKDDVCNARPENDVTAENIEYKQPNGRYAQWTETAPPFGVVTLRITIKGKTYDSFKVIFLPPYNIEHPILRDYDKTRILYRSFDGKDAVFDDFIPKDNNQLNSTKPIRYGEEHDFYEVDVYRPTLIKEVLLDGQIIGYLDATEKLRLPYIFKHRVQINDFSEQGYQAYVCSNLGNIYTQDFIDIAHNPNAGMAAWVAWSRAKEYDACSLDSNAPACLKVYFGLPVSNNRWEGQEALLWDYDRKNNPTIVNPNDDFEFGIVFQDLSKNKDLTCCFPNKKDDNVWELMDRDVSSLKCFEVANDAGIYFFLMQPLMNLMNNPKDVVKELYDPLFANRNGCLTDHDKCGLKRFGEEFCFDWQSHGINID